jgi:alanine racemase
MLTNQADVLIHGRKYPIVGAICMDHLMVNLGDDSSVRAGDDVTLIGRNQGHAISCWDLAEKIGTIPYEITCLITPRVPRVFVG